MCKEDRHFHDCSRPLQCFQVHFSIAMACSARHKDLGFFSRNLADHRTFKILLLLELSAAGAKVWSPCWYLASDTCQYANLTWNAPAYIIRQPMQYCLGCLGATLLSYNVTEEYWHRHMPRMVWGNDIHVNLMWTTCMSCPWSYTHMAPCNALLGILPVSHHAQAPLARSCDCWLMQGDLWPKATLVDPDVSHGYTIVTMPVAIKTKFFIICIASIVLITAAAEPDGEVHTDVALKMVIGYPEIRGSCFILSRDSNTKTVKQQWVGQSALSPHRLDKAHCVNHVLYTSSV